MIATRDLAGRAALVFAQQVGLSVLGTLAATAILAGLKTERMTRPTLPAAERAPTAVSSDLTSGGKFAARLSDGADQNPFVTLVSLPPVLPMFTAPAVPALALLPSRIDLRDAVMADEPSRPVPRPPRLTVAYRDHVRMAAVPSATPHRNPAGTITMAALPTLPETRAEEPGLWSRSTTAYRQVASWSGALIDHLLP